MTKKPSKNPCQAPMQPNPLQINHFPVTGSYPQTDILDIERKTREKRSRQSVDFALTRLDAIFCKQRVCFEDFTDRRVLQIILGKHFTPNIPTVSGRSPTQH